MEETQAQFTDEHVSNDDPFRAMKDVLAGTCGGIAQVMIGQPFDTIKVRLQSAPPGTYSGTLDACRKLVTMEGPAAFYKGTLTPLIGVGACVSIQFGVCEYAKRWFHSKNTRDGRADSSLTSLQFYLSGSAAGIANSILASPIELVRIRLQVSKKSEFSGPKDCLMKIYQSTGFRGIFRGFFPTLIREGHGMGIYFFTYEYLVKHYMIRKEVKDRKLIPNWILCLYGACAGYSMWLTAYPIDVLKSKMQTDSLIEKDRHYKSMISSASKIWAEAGPSGFLKGFIPTMLRAAPVNAGTFLAFELARRAMT